MWIQHRSISELQADYLSALGRAMALAQNFENNCKFVFGTYDFGEAFTAKTLGIKNWRVHGRKLMNRSLGQAIGKRDKDALFRNYVGQLEAARVGRNYLAHQAAEPALYVAPMIGQHKLREVILRAADRSKIEEERREMVTSHVENTLPRFEKAVRDLAGGDSIVSSWSYIIQEKQATTPQIGKSYADEVANWVLEPIRS